MNKLASLSVFVQVTDSGSFAAAGRALGVTASAVGKAIVRLETELGVRLFSRNTRSISLTAEGERLLERARAIMEELASAEQDLATLRRIPSGKLRVSAPLVNETWNRMLMDFVDAHPAIDVEFSYTNRVVDLIEEGFDIGLRIGALKDSLLRVRRLGTFRLLLVASPDYLAAHGTPQTLDELDGHSCLRGRNASTCKLYPWPLGPDAVQRSMRLRGRLIVDHNAMLLTAALRGAGIACLPEFWAREHLRTGRLRLILEEQTTNQRDVSALWPAAHVVAPRVATFIDYVSARLPEVLGGVSPSPTSP